MKNRLPIFIFTGILLLAVAVVSVSILLLPSGELVLRNAETGELYRRFAMGTREEFSVTYISGVSGTPYTDYFVIVGGELFEAGSRYYVLGDGVSSVTEYGQSAENMEDGSIRVTGIGKKIERLVYIIGSESDHILGINGEKYGLTEICGKYSLVEFVYE